ncbi:MAG: phosphatidate cytidylyltransferase, partial [Phycisphaerales bacterium]|nr:phosphatidate cytidylyltransferase [Phycisphaerales bacterium]
VLAVIVGLSVSGLVPEEMEELSGVAIACTGAALVLLASFIFYSRGQTTQGVVSSASSTLLVFVYIGLMGGFLLVLRREYSAWLVLGVLLITKSCDIGAYFTGTAIGRHKLIPWLSPGKTWGGLAGGVATSMLLGGLAIWLISVQPAEVHGVRVDLEWWHGALAGAVLGLVGQGGDLMASLLKRDAGVKDASTVLPGFGGVLDVIDSPLLVAPVVYWLLAAAHASA